MKQINLTILLLGFFNISFGQDTTYRDEDWNIVDKATAYYYSIVVEKNGLEYQKDYFISNDLIQMQGQYSSRNPDIKTGKFVWYHENGATLHIGEYVNNKKNGEHVWFYNDGTISSRETYKMDSLHGNFEKHYSGGINNLLFSYYDTTTYFKIWENYLEGKIQNSGIIVNLDTVYIKVDVPAYLNTASNKNEQLQELVNLLGDIRYPKKSIENKEEDIVNIYAIIDKEGYFKVIGTKGKYKRLNNEAEVIADQLDNFSPALVNGKPVKSRYLFSIEFNLDGLKVHLH